ncbi:MAG TPA: hypothetical protein VL563_02140 [Gemmatimonadales bacterium]|jgi:hypothetical protein|nr:hypothetical protein [Gemmatimonadales bacterium]
MRSLLTLLLCCLVAVAALPAQTGLSYDVPQGWTRTPDPRTGLVSLAPPGIGAPHFCVITVFTPEAFAGTEREFHEQIVRRAISQARVLQPPEQGSVGAFLMTSIHQQLPNGLQLWSRIYTGRWADRGQAFILAADTPDALTRFTPTADAMMSRIAVPQPLAGGDRQPAPSETPSPTGATFGDYLYTAPHGWSSTPSGNGLWIASPPSEAGERCTIGLWPMAPSSGDLFADAQRAWGQVFQGFVIRPEDPLNKTVLVRGRAPQGWDYALLRRGILWPANPDAQLGGSIMVAKLNDRVAIVSFLSKDPRFSSCFMYGYAFHPEVWPRFFANLHFRNWTPPPGSDVAQRIQGSWESFGTSTGGGAALQYAFTPAGRYAFFGVGQRYMALSRFEAAVWTSTTFGDGSYSIRGNELTLRPDHGDPDVYFIRLEQVSEDGGRTWTEKFFMMQPTRSVNLDGATMRDNEVAFERRNP